MSLRVEGQETVVPGGDADALDDPVATNGQRPVAGRLPPIEDPELWDARPAVTRIRDFALARRTSPWAVLGVVLARVVVATSPLVVLPEVVGDVASLNLFVGLVSRSGGGKGASMAAGHAVLPSDLCGDVPEYTIGSGQGIAHAYGAWNRKLGRVERHTTSALLVVEEVDHFAQKHQTASTLMPELRRFFMGEQLGHLYVDPAKRVPIEAHTYRGALLVGIQPERAGVLLEDASGGMPQRFLWLPTEYPHPDERPPSPPPLAWRPPARPGDPHERLVIDVCSTAMAELDAAALARARGEGDPLDAHRLLTREKVAAALGLLDGRYQITDTDWQLSDRVMAVSDLTRAGVLRVLAAQDRAKNRARGEADAEAEDARDRRRAVDCARKLAAKVFAEPERWTRSDLRRAMRRYRDVFDDALDHASAEGWVTEHQEPGQGQERRALRPGHRGPP